MAGAGWSALGAAIQGGQNAFSQRTKDIRDQTEADSRLKSEALMQQLQQSQLGDEPTRKLMLGLQLQRAQHDAAEIPKIDAAHDVAQYRQDYPTDWMSIPAAVNASAQSGVPLPTETPWLQSQKLNAGDGSMGPMDTDVQRSRLQGVAPTTHVTLPSDYIAAQRHNENTIAMDDIQAQGMSGRAGLGGNKSYELGPDNLPLDNAKNRMIESMPGAIPLITKMYGAPGQSPDAVAARERASQAVKTEVAPALMQRVTGQMQSTQNNLLVAQQELEKLYPGIDKSVVTDDQGHDTGSGQYNSAMDLAKAKAHRLQYNFAYTPYNKAIQSASLGNVTGWGTIVPGRINQQIVEKLKEHQSAYGNETPLATYQRNMELIDLIGRNRQDLLDAGQPRVQPRNVGPTRPAPSGPVGGVGLMPDRTSGFDANLDQQTSLNEPPPPQEPPPDQNPPAVSSPPAPAGGFAMLKKGDTVTLDEIQRRWGSPMSPQQLMKVAATYRAHGVQVMGAAAVASHGAPPTAPSMARSAVPAVPMGINEFLARPAAPPQTLNLPSPVSQPQLQLPDWARPRR